MSWPWRGRALLPGLLLALAILSSLSSSSCPNERVGGAGVLPPWLFEEPGRASLDATRSRLHASPHGAVGGAQGAFAANRGRWGGAHMCSLPGLCLRVRGGITVQKMASLGDVKEMPKKLKEYLDKAIAGGRDDEHWTSGTMA